jgi:hypothetical protein
MNIHSKPVEVDVNELRLTFREWCDLIKVRGDQDVVMSVAEWCKITGLSERTAKDILSRGDGPLVVELSPNRIGIRVCDHRAWLAAKTRKKS